MAICNRLSSGCGNTNDSPITNNVGCPDILGCTGACPDFIIKRRDTLPVFKASVEDCDGPLDFQGDNIVVEANMWAKAKLKQKLEIDGESFALADNIGFNQVMVNDIIVMDRIRSPEHMLVTGIDEENKLVNVQRGYNGTISSVWSKGSSMKIFKFMNAPASIETLRQDSTTPDGITQNVLTDTFLVYEWSTADTCLPGCYYLEFKVFEMEHGYSGYDYDHDHHDEYMEGWKEGWDIGVETGENESLDTNWQAWILQKRRQYEKWKHEAWLNEHQEHEHEYHEDPIVIPNAISYISTDVYQCDPLGVKWVRKFPIAGEFLIQIVDSSTIL